MYVLLLITATTIGTVTVQQLGAFGDLQSSETAAAFLMTASAHQVLGLDMAGPGHSETGV